jgi:hypothetical protein
VSLIYACSQAVEQWEIEELGCSCNLDAVALEVDDLINEASDVLYQLSGGAFSRCTNTYRPCRQLVCGCGSPCDCVPDGLPLFQMGPFPTIDQVKIDGEVFSDWAVVTTDGWQRLVRTDGHYWPSYQKVYVADTESNTFSVTVTSGLDWNYTAKNAAIELVCEMAAVLGGKQGLLPPGTVAATMDSVSVQVARLPGQEEIEAVGLTWLSRFLGAYGKRTTGRLVSPELSEGWSLSIVEFGS